MTTIIISIITSAIASSGFFAFLQFLINRKDKKNENKGIYAVALRCLIRSEILKTYCHNKEREMLKQYARENIDQLYMAYKSLGGNSFVEDIYNEMRTWEVEK